jgi:hypothetical protein
VRSSADTASLSDLPHQKVEQMLEILFDAPWWLPTVVIGIGVVLFVTGNNRQEKQLLRGGLGLVLLGLLIVLVSYLVDTDTEKCVKRTRQLVSSVNQRDWQTFKSLIDARTKVFTFVGPDAITSAAQTAVQRTNVGNIRITGAEVTKAQTVINVNIRVLSDQFGTSGVSDWQLQYQNLGRGWELFHVQPLPGSPGSQVPEGRIQRELTGQ